VRAWLRRIGVALTQLLNSIVGGNPDVMTSARAHRLGVLERRWPWTWLAWALNKLDPGHTERAWRADRDEWGE